MKIDKRTFIVSGGSSGLGLATVRKLLAHNAYLAIVDLSAPPDDLAQDRTRFFKADVAQTEEVGRVVEECVAWTQKTGAILGGLISAAGIGSAAKIIDGRGEPVSLEHYKHIMDVNLVGTFDLTRQVCRHLVSVPPEGPDRERGVVVMVSSSAAFDGQPGLVAYAASKGGINAMTMPLALDLARYGIRVNTIAPATFESNLTARSFTPRQRKSLQLQTVFPPRFGRPDEFAETVRWMVECSYANGETVRLTGGTRLPGKL